MHPVDAPITQEFGTNPGGYNPAGGHTGRDYGCWRGTACRAIAPGTVVAAGTLPGPYTNNPWWIEPAWAGNVLVIDHGAYLTTYSHLDVIHVHPGQRVEAGDVVALSGNTGSAVSGDHLHFEVLPDGFDLSSNTYGRVHPGPYIDAPTLTLASAIITHLQEAGVALELKDLEAIQGIVQTERTTIVNEIRANAEALAAAIVRESYGDKVFTQAELQTERATIVAEVRANAAAAVNALKDNSDG